MKEPTFPMQRTCPLDPAPEFREAYEEGRFVRMRMWDDQQVWLATHYDDVQQVLISPSFSQNPQNPNYPFPTKARATLMRTEPPAMNQMDPPVHTKFRRLFGRMFTAKKMEALRPRVQEIVDILIDRMLAQGDAGNGTADLYVALAAALPAWVMAEVLGVPLEDQDLFQSLAHERFTYNDADYRAPLAAGEKLRTYLDSFIARREQEATEGEDVVTRLVIDQIRPGHITREEAIIHIRQVLLAGHDTTANMIALGVLLLLRHPDEVDKLKANPSLADGAVEEMLRYLSVAHFNCSRVAVEDVDIGGHVIKAGEGIVASIAAANRDPQMFPEPDRLDITRDASRHIAFADGIHMCVGQPVARLELQVVFATLFRRIPTLRLAAPIESLTFTSNTAVYGVTSLPVAW